MPYKNRIRLPIMFTKPQFPVERNVFRKADGSSKVLSMIVKNTYEGSTDQLPEDWHRKLVVALSHDEVTIENERLMSDVVLAGDYSISWEDFLNKPIAPASFTVEVTPFNATNNNCQTCEEMTQVYLVDDYTDEVWAEGTTNIYPDVLTDNDSICCHPYTISLVWFNTNYFASASIDANGILTATVLNPSPTVDDVQIASYRVTCADGSYDDAIVYGNVSGSTINFCLPPVGPIVTVVSSTEVNVSWDVGLPTPVQWIWELYLTSDLGTIIQSGTVIPPSVDITGLSSGVSYTCVVVADCGGGSLSTPVSVEFDITPFAGSTCGNFQVTYIPYADDAPQSISYMDCAGDIQNVELTYAQVIERCMLITPGGTTPIYFVASSSDISILYLALC